MMREAVQNERLATNQRLEDAYLAQLKIASRTLQNGWNDELQEATRNIQDLKPPLAFATFVNQSIFDSVIIRNSEQELLYPQPANPNTETPTVFNQKWRQGEELEFVTRRYAEAIAVYQSIADETKDLAEQGLAKQALVRCLLKANEKEKAIKLLETIRRQTDLLDNQGRSFSIAAELRLLQLCKQNSEDAERIASRLLNRINSYNDPMSSAQRRFVMKALRSLIEESEGSDEWPLQNAELLANNYLSSYSKGSQATISVTEELSLTEVPSLYHQTLSDGNSIALLKSSTIEKHLDAILETINCPTGVAYSVSSLEEDAKNLYDLPLEGQLQGWQIGLKVVGDDPFDASSQQRRTVHLWIACLIVAVTCLLAWLLATTLHQRLKLARLKNDLVATVSHELKTPLASVRLLVDTLLESTEEGARVSELDRKASPVNVREYLELISQENARLTRLIEKFLTFSRIERGKQRFDFNVLEVEEVISKAVELFQDHREIDQKALTIRCEEQAFVYGDHDALVLAVVNLLENAWKYSGEEKQIALSTAIVGELVTISVSDNGIGLSNYAKNRVFDKFYQVDQRVARTAEGCGLGLSIVSSIMKEHGGGVKVLSKQKAGSTFTLSLSAVKEDTVKEDAAKEDAVKNDAVKQDAPFEEGAQ